MPSKLNSRLCAALILAHVAPLVLAQSEYPPSGITVDRTDTVPQRIEVPRSCIALVLDEALVLLDRDELRQEARKLATGPRKDIENLLKIHGVGLSGCVEVTPMQLVGKTYPFTSGMRKGRAVVLSSSDRTVVPRILVRYDATANISGNVFYYVPGRTRPFHVEFWWAS